MFDTLSMLSSLTRTIDSLSMSIVDGCSCSIKGYIITIHSYSLTLCDVLCVPKFLTYIESISDITHALNYVAIFYLFHFIFRDPHISWRIGLGCENNYGIYELVFDTPSLELLFLFMTSTFIHSLF